MAFNVLSTFVAEVPLLSSLANGMRAIHSI